MDAKLNRIESDTMIIMLVNLRKKPTLAGIRRFRGWHKRLQEIGQLEYRSTLQYLFKADKSSVVVNTPSPRRILLDVTTQGKNDMSESDDKAAIISG